MAQVRVEEKPCYYSKPKFFKMRRKGTMPQEYFMRCIEHDNGPCPSPPGTIAIVSETREGKVRHLCLRCCGRKD